MKSLFILVTAATISVSAFAGGMSEHRDMNEMHRNSDSGQENEDILKNNDMQRTHKQMTLNGLSEVGMEARRKMISEEGRAYHRALEKK